MTAADDLMITTWAWQVRNGRVHEAVDSMLAVCGHVDANPIRP